MREPQEFCPVDRYSAFCLEIKNLVSIKGDRIHSPYLKTILWCVGWVYGFAAQYGFASSRHIRLDNFQDDCIIRRPFILKVG